MRLIFLSLVSIIIGFSCAMNQAPNTSIQSPSENISVEFGLNSNGQAYYTASFENQAVIDTSYLGFELQDSPNLKENLSIVQVHTSTFNETWEQPWGEQQFIKNHYNELRIELQEKTNEQRRFDIVFRVFDDGIGFRYEFPEQESMRNLAIVEELTEFNLAQEAKAWWIPAFEPNRYEYLYKHTPVAEMGKVHTPVTFETENQVFLSIHEAALINYSSMVVHAKNGKELVCELVPYSQEEVAKAFVTAPSVTPWRTIQIGNSAADLLASFLILNLNEPNKLGDVSWFQPGKYVGIWWELHIEEGSWSTGPKHGANTENMKKYIDFAAEHGFQGVLVEGWNTGWNGDWTAHGDEFNFTETTDDFDIEAISAYAQSKNVYIVGHHETAGFVDNYEKQLTDAFDFMHKYGYKAVKTGYVEHGNLLSNGKNHHGQAYIEHFNKVIQIAAKNKIAVVAHEPIKDTGERRTYPNMISREGARGQEFNAWSDDGGNPPNHTLILPFTRCLSGPMDFTPGVFDIKIPNKPNNQVNTTLVKQLALYVTMYSPMQMACDLPRNYNKYPDAFQFIKDVGVDWETSQVLEAKIGSYLTVARKEKNTGNWFVGSICDENKRQTQIVLDFLDAEKEYEATIYRDGPDADYQTNPESYVIEKITVQKGDSISADLASSGGLAISLTIK